MTYSPHASIRSVVAPPIAEVQEWVKGRQFPADRPLLDVSQAVPSYAPAPELIQHLQQRIGEPATHLYTDILGRRKLRQALAEDIRQQYGAEVRSEQIAITAGCNQAFCLCIDALAAAGDEVILTSPYYFNHQMWLQMRGIRTIIAQPDQQLLPNVEAVAHSISDKTRAIVLVTPNNPTGAQYPADLLLQLFQLARQAGIALIVDETYRDFRHSEQPPHRLFEQVDWDQTFIHLYSFSKSFALTGHRVGAIGASPKLLEEVAKIMDCAIICAPHLGQEAALFGLHQLTEWRDNKSRQMRERVAAMQQQFGQGVGGWQLAACGAFFAYLRHPLEQGALFAARHLADEANILCLPGTVFGEDQEQYLRFAFANLDEQRIPQLFERLRTIGP